MINRVKPIPDATVWINVATLLGIDGSKKNDIWWQLIKDFADSKNKYNYQMEIAYELKYEKVEELKSPKANNIILRCFKNLRPIYDTLVSQ